MVNFDFAGEHAELGGQSQYAWDAIDDATGCNVDSLGLRHDPAGRCDNRGYDEVLGTYCKVRHASDTEQQRSHTQ